MHWSSATIEVTGAVLRAGKDTLALSDADEVLALDERQAMALRGPQADPSAHILLRPYLKRAVYVSLADPGEGVPYWLVATGTRRSSRPRSRPPPGLVSSQHDGPPAGQLGVRGMMTHH